MKINVVKFVGIAEQQQQNNNNNKKNCTLATKQSR